MLALLGFLSALKVSSDRRSIDVSHTIRKRYVCEMSGCRISEESS